MRRGHHRNKQNDTAVVTLIEYVIVTGILLFLFVILMLLVNTNFMTDPANTLRYYAYTDIGNGVSTRIIDVYSIAPQNGTISTSFALPEDVGGMNYFVAIEPSSNLNDQDIMVWGNIISSNISLAEIDLTPQGTATGNTTGGGINMISYNSNGF